MRLGQDHHGYYDRDVPRDGCHVFTAFVEFPDGGVEEIDVLGVNVKHARRVTEAALARDYQQPDKARIVRMIHRPAGWMFF